MVFFHLVIAMTTDRNIHADKQTNTHTHERVILPMQREGERERKSASKQMTTKIIL